MATSMSRSRRGALALSVVALTMTLVGMSVMPAFGADVHEPHIGTTCEAGGLWHFVHNQIDPGTPAGELTAVFSISGEITVEANKVLNQTQHYDIIAAGELLSASDTIEEGMLVLSHVDCEDTTTTTTKPTTTSSSVVITTSSTTSTTKPSTTTTKTEPSTTTSSSVVSTTSTTKPPSTTTTVHDTTTTTKHDSTTTSSTRVRSSTTTKPPRTTTTDGKDGRMAKWMGEIDGHWVLDLKI